MITNARIGVPLQRPGSEVRHTEITCFTNFRTDRNASKASLSTVVHGSEVRAML
jgi:hypothetical protein